MKKKYSFAKKRKKEEKLLYVQNYESSPPQDQATPLHVAARNNSVDAAKVLIDHGADVHARDKVSLRKKTSLFAQKTAWFRD